MTLTVVLGALELGLIFAVLALGIFISFRILDTPDLTVDGSFVLGVAVSSIFTVNGHPFVGLLLSVAAGFIAGALTGILHTKVHIQPILAGILVMTALYSINMRIMGKKPNLSFYDTDTVFTKLRGVMDKHAANLVVTAVVLIIVFVLLFLFLKTQVGMSLRATGDNEAMVRASSIDSDKMKILGMGVANALVALSGAEYAQYSGFGDANGGVGMLVVGLASIIVGEVIFGRRSVLAGMLSSVVGAIIYRFVLTIALRLGMESIDMKLFSAVIVTVAVAVPAVKNYIGRRRALKCSE